MEHRWSERIPVRLDAKIYDRDGREAPCITRDIGLEGASLQIRHGIYPRGVRIDVELAFSVHGRTLHKRLPAVVMHCCAEFTGIMFLAFNQAVFRFVEELLDALRHAQARELVDDAVANYPKLSL